jgi:hypothetical protein
MASRSGAMRTPIWLCLLVGLCIASPATAEQALELHVLDRGAALWIQHAPESGVLAPAVVH